MQYLMEMEAGYDTDRLGFPSIQGCHAIVLLTRDGIFGFHNAGGSGTDRFDERARLFAAYVRRHAGRKVKGTHLYGSTFVGNNQRGYSGNPRETWQLELGKFAGALGFRGPIGGCDLAQSITAQGASAYVEYRRVGQACLIFAKQWSTKGIVRVPYAPTRDLEKIVGTQANQLMTTGVDASGLTKIDPEVVKA
jgi:hypothetical protein